MTEEDLKAGCIKFVLLVTWIGVGALLDQVGNSLLAIPLWIVFIILLWMFNS